MAFNQSVMVAIKRAAKENHLPEVNLLAVASVESAGTATWNVGGKQVPPARPEGHYFYARLSGAKRKRAVAEGLAAKKAGVVKVPRSRAAVYDMIHRMEAIDKNAARESCSWGLGQVMGAWWKDLGYRSVDDLVLSCSTVSGQVDLMIRYVKKYDLERAMVDGGKTASSWREFAKGYNGPRYARQGYHTKLAKAFVKYSGADANGDEVREAQGKLKKLGYYKLGVDGVRGKGTISAIKAFQKDHGLVVDGKVGKMTMDELDEALRKRTSKRADKTVVTGVGTSALGTAGERVLETTDQLSWFAGDSQIFTWVIMGLVGVGVALTLYGLYRKFTSRSEE